MLTWLTGPGESHMTEEANSFCDALHRLTVSPDHKRLATWLIMHAQTLSDDTVGCASRSTGTRSTLERPIPIAFTILCCPAPTQIHVSDAEQKLSRKRIATMAQQMLLCFKTPSCTLSFLLGRQIGRQEDRHWRGGLLV